MKKALVFVALFVFAMCSAEATTVKDTTAVDIGGTIFLYKVDLLKSIDASPFKLVEEYTIVLMDVDTVLVATSVERWNYALQDSTIDSVTVRPVNRGLFSMHQSLSVVGRGTLNQFIVGESETYSGGLPAIVEPPAKTIPAAWARMKTTWENRFLLVPLEPTKYRAVTDVIEP